jgi:hypothetical protein
MAEPKNTFRAAAEIEANTPITVGTAEPKLMSPEHVIPEWTDEQSQWIAHEVSHDLRHDEPDRIRWNNRAMGMMLNRIAALEAQVREQAATIERLTAESNDRRKRLRKTAQIIIDAIGSTGGPEDADEAALRIAPALATVTAERDRLRRDHAEFRSRIEDITRRIGIAASPNSVRGELEFALNKDSLAAARQTKTDCPHCGYLNDEDALTTPAPKDGERGEINL